MMKNFAPTDCMTAATEPSTRGRAAEVFAGNGAPLGAMNTLDVPVLNSIFLAV